MSANGTTELEDKNPPMTKKTNPRLPYIIIFAVMGILGIFSGIINLYLMIAASNVIVIEPIEVVLGIVYGALLLISSFMVSKGKVIAIWLFGGAILVNVTSNFVLGRSFNFFIVLMGIVFLTQLFNFKKQGELS